MFSVYQMKIMMIGGLVLLISLSLFGQEEKTELYMELISWKYQDDSRELIAKLSGYDDERGDFFPAGVPVDFYVLNPEGEEDNIGSAESGDDGNAVLKIEPGTEFPRDEEGYMQFYARFEGNDLYEYSEAELMIKDARISIDFQVIDSVRTVVYSGVMENEAGVEEPLADDDLYLYIPRMFNLLRIEEGWLEEDGTGMFEFPLDIVGDSTGMIKVIARVEEHFDYGNLEATGEIQWAIPKHSEKFEGPQRELWTPIAPLWMIITLIIMLTGVWGHYIYAMYELYKIKKIGDKAK